MVSLHLFAIDETLQLLRGTAGHGSCRRGGGKSPPVGVIKTFHVSKNKYNKCSFLMTVTVWQTTPLVS